MNTDAAAAGAAASAAAPVFTIVFTSVEAIAAAEAATPAAASVFVSFIVFDFSFDLIFILCFYFADTSSCSKYRLFPISRGGATETPTIVLTSRQFWRQKQIEIDVIVLTSLTQVKIN